MGVGIVAFGRDDATEIVIHCLECLVRHVELSICFSAFCMALYGATWGVRLCEIEFLNLPSLSGYSAAISACECASLFETESIFGANYIHTNYISYIHLIS